MKRKTINYFILLGVLVLGIFFVGIASDFQYPYSAFKDRDPLKPLVNDRGEILIKEGQQGTIDFLLQGILYSSDGSSTAIINNQVYKQGDTFDGYTIKSIEKNEIFLEKNGEEFNLKWEG